MRSFLRRGHPGTRGFTLIELLVVLSIVAVLVGMLLAAGDLARRRSAAARARSEIAALGGGLERYKLENDKLPATTPIATNSATGYAADPAAYRDNAAVLFSALAGRDHFADAPAGPVFYEFKKNQVMADASNGGDGAMDPFKNAYGFTTDVAGQSTNAVFDKGFFDLWSTGGQPANGTRTNNWISNWKDGS